jgi:hypothetical protein
MVIFDVSPHKPLTVRWEIPAWGLGEGEVGIRSSQVVEEEDMVHNIHPR